MSTHNIPFTIIKKKITLCNPKSAAMGFLQGTQERVRNSRGKCVISAVVTEGLLSDDNQSLVTWPIIFTL